MRKGDQATFQVRAFEQGDGRRLRLDIDALTPEGGFRDRLPIDVTALDTATGETKAVHAEQIAPGSYRAEFDLPAPDGDAGGGGATTMFSVSSSELTERPYVFGHTRSYPREFLRTDTDEGFLRALALAGSGRFDPPAADIFAAPTHFSARRVDLTNDFLAAALLLLPLDIFLRRRTWKLGSTAARTSRPTRETVAS